MSITVKPALLVIDIQNAYLESMANDNKEKALLGINNFIGYFRAKGFPIVHVYHEDVEYGYGPKPGTEAFEFPKNIAVQPNDPKVIKHYGDAFNKTELDSILKAQGVNTVFLCGLSATGCVMHTYVGAWNHDYKAFLLKGVLLSGDHEYTKCIENAFDAVSWMPLLAMTGN